MFLYGRADISFREIARSYVRALLSKNARRGGIEHGRSDNEDQSITLMKIKMFQKLP